MTDNELTAAAAEAFRELDRREAADLRRQQLTEWVVSVFCWDGLLPIAVIAIPNAVKMVLPNWRMGLPFLFAFSPVIALSVRFVIGWGRMRKGQSYFWQLVVFTIAIAALFLFEEFLLNDQLGGGPKIGDPKTMSVIFSLYLSMMAIAIYPFNSSSSHSCGGN